MKIWWFWRFMMEGYYFWVLGFWFMGAGGYMWNYRRRYVKHKQKRQRSFFRNPYFVAPGERKLSYDKFFNVKKDNLLIEKMI